MAAAAKPINILVLVGTRPEAIKMFPVVHALERSEHFAPIVVTTGQHRDLVRPIFDLAGITADLDLGIEPGLSLNGLVSSVITTLDAFCRERFHATGTAVASREQIRESGFPAGAFVHGDTSSAAAAAIASFNLRIPVGHVEAGLRTGTTLTPFPEELNRQLISRIAAFHLAPTAINRQNLVREGIADERIFVTGNTGLDALRFAAALDVPFADRELQDLVESRSRYIVLTAHRRENWGGGLARIADGISRLAAAHPDVRIVAPLHPNPLVHEELGVPIAAYPNVLVTEPLAYAEFARLMARSALVLTDSGGIQEEAPALGVPVLVARDGTERHEGLVAGTLRLVGTDPALIAAAAGSVLANTGLHRIDPAANPYGDGHAAKRIVDALEFLAGFGPPPNRYGPAFSRKEVLEAGGYPFGMFSTPVADRGEAPDRSEELDEWVGR